MQTWRPTTSFKAIKERAALYERIRLFFAKHGILEVETPILSQHTVTDLHIESFSTCYIFGHQQQRYYLQTSPEYAMKRLLAADYGPIFQICKSFRNGESGKQHNPEFSMLEWYRPGFNHHQLMQEIDEFLQFSIQTNPTKKISYQQLFIQYLNIDPIACTADDLNHFIQQQEIYPNKKNLDKDTCLQLLMSHSIEKNLGFDQPVFIYDFPASQAALAKINQQNPKTAARFELFINGIEIANGFHELTNAAEQRNRFKNDQQQRHQQQLNIPEIDERLMQALIHGMPDCSGVALGLDRLLMLKMKSTSIEEVINFPWNRA